MNEHARRFVDFLTVNPQVIGALEVEAHFGHEFKGHEEELLQYMADTTSALLDIMRQIRTGGDKDKKKGVGVLQATNPAPTPLKA